jgi:hypothetical protein
MCDRQTKDSEVMTHPAPSEQYFSNIAGFEVTQEFYGQGYFEGQKQIHETGYPEYAPGPWVGMLSTLVREFLTPTSLLDVGCARGYIVEHLRAAGVAAFGSDYSAYAVKSAPPAARPLLIQADATAMPYGDGAFDTVICVETLEHLYPWQVPPAARELARMTRRWLLLSMPTFGVDAGGQAGIAIVDPEHQQDAEANRPFRKLILDPQGNPHHGHLTLATWRWWTDQFEAAGLERQRWLEREIYTHPWADPNTWHFYVFCHPGVAERERRAPAVVDMAATPRWQLSAQGWHALEDADGATYRWTEARAGMRLAYQGQRRISVGCAGGPRAPLVEILVNGRSLGSFATQQGWGTIAAALPADLHGDELAVELLPSATFVPAERLPGSEDTRQLGVMVARAWLS